MKHTFGEVRKMKHTLCLLALLVTPSYAQVAEPISKASYMIFEGQPEFCDGQRTLIKIDDGVGIGVYCEKKTDGVINLAKGGENQRVTGINLHGGPWDFEKLIEKK